MYNAMKSPISIRNSNVANTPGSMTDDVNRLSLMKFEIVTPVKTAHAIENNVSDNMAIIIVFSLLLWKVSRSRLTSNARPTKPLFSFG